MKKPERDRDADRDETPAHHVPADRKNRSAVNPVLDLQRAAGNQAVNQLLGSASKQTRLRISQPGEPEEIEAERLSREVGGESDGETGQAQTTNTGHPGGAESLALDPGTDLGAGQQMDAGAQADMEAQFGHDFSGVRIHSDSRAAASARAVGARAYTVGKDVVFDSGEYAPQTKAGKRLLAHELTHIVQQGMAPRTSSGDAPVVRGPSQGAGGGVLQRQPADPTKPATTSTPTATPAPQPGPAQLTQAFYDQACNSCQAARSQCYSAFDPETRQGRPEGCGSIDGPRPTAGHIHGFARRNHF